MAQRRQMNTPLQASKDYDTFVSGVTSRLQVQVLKKWKQYLEKTAKYEK